jgi:hypothetical protein
VWDNSAVTALPLCAPTVSVLSLVNVFPTLKGEDFSSESLTFQADT